MLHIERVEPGPGEEPLYRELYAGLPVPMPPLDGHGGDGGDGDGGGRWREPAGVVAAREDGALVAWAVFFAEAPGSTTAVLQWIVVERERRRITAGHNTEDPGTRSEIDVLAVLATETAGRARAAGYTRLRWQPAEPDLAEGVADRLDAEAVDEAGFRFYRLPL